MKGDDQKKLLFYCSGDLMKLYAYTVVMIRDEIVSPKIYVRNILDTDESIVVIQVNINIKLMWKSSDRWGAMVEISFVWLQALAKFETLLRSKTRSIVNNIMDTMDE